MEKVSPEHLISLLIRQLFVEVSLCVVFLLLPGNHPCTVVDIVLSCQDMTPLSHINWDFIYIQLTTTHDFFIGLINSKCGWIRTPALSNWWNSPHVQGIKALAQSTCGPSSVMTRLKDQKVQTFPSFLQERKIYTSRWFLLVPWLVLHHHVQCNCHDVNPPVHLVPKMVNRNICRWQMSCLKSRFRTCKKQESHFRRRKTTRRTLQGRNAAVVDGVTKYMWKRSRKVGSHQILFTGIFMGICLCFSSEHHRFPPVPRIPLVPQTAQRRGWSCRWRRRCPRLRLMLWVCRSQRPICLQTRKQWQIFIKWQQKTSGLTFCIHDWPGLICNFDLNCNSMTGDLSLSCKCRDT